MPDAGESGKVRAAGGWGFPGRALGS